MKSLTALQPGPMPAFRQWYGTAALQTLRQRSVHVPFTFRLRSAHVPRKSCCPCLTHMLDSCCPTTLEPNLGLRNASPPCAHLNTKTPMVLTFARRRPPPGLRNSLNFSYLLLKTTEISLLDKTPLSAIFLAAYFFLSDN